METNNELEMMREQLNMLNNKLNNQQIINDRLMMEVLNSKMNNLRKRFWRQILISCFALIYCPFCFIKVMHLSIAFSIFTEIFLLMALCVTLYSHFKLQNSDLYLGNLVNVSTDIMKVKKAMRNWQLIGTPFVIIFAGGIFYELTVADLNEHSRFVILLGCAIGLVIGLIIGFYRYFGTQHQASEIINKIDEIKEQQ